MRITDKLNEYRRYLHQEHPDIKPTVKVLKKRGWLTFPTGYRAYLVDLLLSGTGYRTKTATLYIPQDPAEHWYVR